MQLLLERVSCCFHYFFALSFSLFFFLLCFLFFFSFFLFSSFYCLFGAVFFSTVDEKKGHSFFAVGCSIFFLGAGFSYLQKLNGTLIIVRHKNATPWRIFVLVFFLFRSRAQSRFFSLFLYIYNFLCYVFRFSFFIFRVFQSFSFSVFSFQLSVLLYSFSDFCLLLCHLAVFMTGVRLA